jgi:hypothetical protein
MTNVWNEESEMNPSFCLEVCDYPSSVKTVKWFFWSSAGTEERKEERKEGRKEGGKEGRREGRNK